MYELYTFENVFLNTHMWAHGQKAYWHVDFFLLHFWKLHKSREIVLILKQQEQATKKKKILQALKTSVYYTY